MSLPVIAIIVASFSAAGTVANMVAAWSNYRRVTPRAEVSAKWLIFGAHEWEDPMGTFLVDVTNTSQSQIKIKDLFLRIDLAPQDLIDNDGEDCHVALDVIEGDTDEAIPPMGGVDLKVEVGDEAKEVMDELIPYVKRVRVEVTLTNTSKMVSKWISKKDQFWVHFDDLVEVVKAQAAYLGHEPTLHKQLSFDELNETK